MNNYIKSVLQKLDATHRTEAVTWAHEFDFFAAPTQTATGPMVNNDSFEPLLTSGESDTSRP